ncbi:MAG TPA: TerB family tellurite resistance protein [Minicystis sp.]|nr:TerB family tellurite resistance protein [Minicystis sp.]
MGLLAWLGLQKAHEYPNLDVLLKELRRALPDDEQVVLRYIAIVIVLLGKVAVADGRFSAKEDQALHVLLTRVGRIAPDAVDRVCQALQGKLPSVTDAELELCYRELRSICDHQERVEVVRLLLELAEVDGDPCTSENAEVERVAQELGVSLAEVVRMSSPRG